MEKKDCFAYNETDNVKQECLALTSRVCKEKNCSFYKTSDCCDSETKRLIREQREMFAKEGN